MSIPKNVPKNAPSTHGSRGLRQRILFWLAVLLLMAYGVREMITMPGTSYQGALPELTPEQAALSQALSQHVNTLAGTIGKRNLWYPHNLNQAADYIEQVLTHSGYTVKRHPYTVGGQEVYNLEVEIKGHQDPDKIIVIGAHYDTVRDSPGADDNGSGVAALLALAKDFANTQPAYTLRFVAFVNEDHPLFTTQNMGSYRYAKNAKAKQENIVAMVSLESIGYYPDTKGSQHYPMLLGAFYPSRGNFIGFVSNFASRPLLYGAISTFREKVKFPSEGIAGPSLIPGISWSDHWAFWKFGYPAIMVTDTALYRNPHYHASSDTPNKVNYGKLARVVSGLKEVIKELP